MALRKIGEAVTDSNGNCIIPYTGTGAGEVDLTACYYEEDTSSIIQSETHSILDCIFLDYAVTGSKNNNWENYSNRLTISTDENGTKLTGASSNGYYIVNASNKHIFTDYTCEFDILNLEGSVRWYHELASGSGENVFTFNTYVTGACSVKITVSNGVATLYVNGVVQGTTSLTLGSPYLISFRTPNGTANTITYKNFKVYPI